MSATAHTVQVTYTIRNKEGYVVDRQRQFTTANAAYVFMKTIKQEVMVIGSPVMVVK